jgi:deferrochelatase/peroxidase EfeB
MDGNRERSIPRRQFVRSAVAIGGASALAACTQRETTSTDGEGPNGDGTATVSETTYPRGDLEALPAGQHRWSNYLVRDSAGNTVPPQHQLVLGLEYEGAAPPTEGERERVDAAFRTLDRAFQWGTGGDEGATFNRGLLSLVGYAPSYFESFGAVPEDLVRPETILAEVGEDASKTDGFDAVVILTSDLGSVVLAAEQALLGEKERVNGVEVAGSLDGVFSVKKRRTGFAGKGLPADKLDQEEIPEEAPLSMGFKSGFTDSLPSEDAVTIREGPFAGGTTLALSRLRLHLDRWYDQDHEDRVEEMFCPAHDAEEVGPVGSNLGDDSGIDRTDVENIDEQARESGKYGHTAKVATARDEEFEPRILRRSEGFATDAPEHTGFNFSGVQRDFEAFIEARKAMNVDEYEVDVPAENHGIVDYVDTVDRGAYVVPPRADRGLPIPEA